MKKLNSLTYMIAILPIVAIIIFFSSCTKEGPMGPAGKDGTNGTNGVNSGTTCTQCHNGNVVEAIANQFEFSKHNYGEAAISEAGNAACAPCHESDGFKYVCENNIPATFTLNATTGKYANDYSATAATAYGNINCFTCHNKLHSKYDSTDLPGLTSVAQVSLTMWGGKKSVNLSQKNGIGNLCVKCHQPRPLTTSTTLSDGNVVDYAAMASNPTGIFYDTTKGSTTNKLNPSYRTGIHYGTVGADFAGTGAVEFGTGYSNSFHTANASCEDCHMATMTGAAGGHSFFTKGNFNGCNAIGCHASTPITAKEATHWTTPRATIKDLLNQLAAKLVQDGIEILATNADATSNLWYGLTSKNYDGYINYYDPSTYPTGKFQNPSASSSWTLTQIATNNLLPKLKLTNAQMGAIINFQFCLRENSLGIHNYKYTKAVLDNTLAIL